MLIKVKFVPCGFWRKVVAYMRRDKKPVNEVVSAWLKRKGTATGIKSVPSEDVEVSLIERNRLFMGAKTLSCCGSSNRV